MLRVGVDVGGTFTDLMLVDDETGSVVVHKIASTPSDPSEATMIGLRELCELGGVVPSDVAQLLHGTTVATNIVLERNGSTTGMITTRGFRDIIYIGRHRRPKTFSIYQDLPWREPTLVARRNRHVVSERVVPPGDVDVPLDEGEVRAAAAELREAQVEAVAVCFLFSFLNPQHERRVKEILEEELPGVHLSISHEVVPQHREYERFSTTALDAYIGPKTSRYLRNMHTALRDVAPDTDFHLMASNGGTLTIDGAVSRPTQLLMSGPVAGIVGGIAAARSAGYRSVITLDVGGTSADIGVAPDAVVRMKHLYDTNLGGYEVMIPMVDLDTIGAGGGSLARVDAGGLLRVGTAAARVPIRVRSAMAAAVPSRRPRTRRRCSGACAAAARLAGDLELDVDGARVAVASLGERLGLDVDERRARHHPDPHAEHGQRDQRQQRAEGLRPARLQPRRVRRRRAALRGRHRARAVDPAGHRAAAPRDHLGDGSAGLRPQVRGAADGHGGGAGRRRRRARRASSPSWRLNGRAALDADDVPEADRVFERWADCRYVGQAYELLVPVPSGPLDDTALATLAERFEEAHEREYFYRFPGKAVQIVHVRSYAIGLMPSIAPERHRVG